MKQKSLYYSYKDIIEYIHCKYCSHLNITNPDHPKDLSKNSIASVILAQKLKIEKDIIDSFSLQNKKIGHVNKHKSLIQQCKETKSFIKDGYDIIYNPTLIYNKWIINSSFLSKNDDNIYEVLELELSKEPSYNSIIKLVFHSFIISMLFKCNIVKMHLSIRGKECRVFNIMHYLYYIKYITEDFIKFTNSFKTLNQYPLPCLYCDICKWKDICNSIWVKDQHISLTANIKNDEIVELLNSGIRNLSDLNLLNNNSYQMKDINIPLSILNNIQNQGLLQLRSIQTNKQLYKLINLKDQDYNINKGFIIIPEPSKYDIFLNIEGNPNYHNDEGIEYLFSLIIFNDEEQNFKYYWAHNYTEEKESFLKITNYLYNHIQNYPNSYIYHYNNYESSSLRKLSCKYNICGDIVDSLLRNRKFIDLYTVIKENIIISKTNYSIKSFESFYMKNNHQESILEFYEENEIIVEYNNWVKTQDPNIASKILEYTKNTCISILKLRDWLLKVRPKNIKHEIYKPKNEGTKRTDIINNNKLLDEQLNQKYIITQKEYYSNLRDFIDFYNREEKAIWWSIFDLGSKSSTELIKDGACIYGMRLIKIEIDPSSKKGYKLKTYEIPKQNFKIIDNSYAINIQNFTNIGTIKVNDNLDRLYLKCNKLSSEEELPNLTITFKNSISSKILQDSINNLIKNFIKNNINDNIITKFLCSTRVLKEINKISYHDINHIIKQIENLDKDYFVIQGPPGTGKTYTTGMIISKLLKNNYKIGVTANSHKVIHNLLKSIDNHSKTNDIVIKGIKKCSSNNEETKYYNSNYKNISSNSELKKLDLNNYNLLSGTSWFFANNILLNQLDFLFIDEASQLSSANLIAISRSTKNIILIGDHMQLTNPIQGVHPNNSDKSAIEYIMSQENHSNVINIKNSIFLNTTMRLNPKICNFISKVFYNNQLNYSDTTKYHQLIFNKNTNNRVTKNLITEGIHLIKVDHTHNIQKSIEEVNIIKDLYQYLLQQKYHNTNTNIKRNIQYNDIMIISPYNLQVQLLKKNLPNKAYIGTIDKFQGQEALITIISLTSSDLDFIQKNFDFFYNPNRLNVGLSRSKCLSIVVYSEAIFNTICNTINQVKLINNFYTLKHYCKNQDFII